MSQPSSHKDKNIFDDQLITGKPNPTKNMKVKSRKKKTMGEPESKYNYKNLDHNEENMGIPYSSHLTEIHDHEIGIRVNLVLVIL